MTENFRNNITLCEHWHGIGMERNWMGCWRGWFKL